MNTHHAANHFGLVAVITLAVCAVILGAVCLWYAHRIYQANMRLYRHAGWLAGFKEGRDHGYNVGVDDTRRGVEYCYDWEGNPIDDEQSGQEASGDTRPGNGDMDNPAADTGGTLRIVGADTPGNMGSPVGGTSDARPDGRGKNEHGDRVPDNQAGNSDRVDGQGKAAPLLALPTAEDTFWQADALELHQGADADELRAAEWLSAIGAEHCPCGRLPADCGPEGCTTMVHAVQYSPPPPAFDLLGDTDAFVAIHTAFDTLWTDVIEPPFTLPPWEMPRRSIR